MSLLQDNIYYAGDTIKLSFQLWRDKVANIPWDLTTTQIRFQLNTPALIKKATVNVPGGAATQITINDASLGLFTVNILKTETGLVVGDFTFEIEITETNGERFTILQTSLRILPEYITWGDL